MGGDLMLCWLNKLNSICGAGCGVAVILETTHRFDSDLKYSEMECGKLSELRKLMEVHSIDGYLVPHEDSHFSEYVSNEDKRVKFISNFSGSAGFCIVTMEHAILFSDSRYEIQSKRELDADNWMFGNSRGFKGKKVEEFIEGYLDEGCKIGVDPIFISEGSFRSFEGMLKSISRELVSIRPNLIDEIWKEKPRDVGSIFIHEEKYSGESTESKLQRIRDEMSKKKADVLIIASMDEVAWTCNLRGRNLVPFCGTFPSWLIIHQKVNDEIMKDEDEEDEGENEKEKHETVILFVDRTLFENEEETIEHLKRGGIMIRPYEQFFEDFKQLGEGNNNDDEENENNEQRIKIMLDPGKFSHFYTQCVPKESLILSNSPVRGLKMRKNSVEISGFKNALDRDCAALVNFYRWIEHTLQSQPESEELTEYNASIKLEGFRREVGKDSFVGTAFETICSVGSNAAVIHYHAEKDAPSMKRINDKEVLLVDSGGHYQDGSTDTTRTRHFGTPTEEIKKYYTHVLKGHIAFARLKFPEKSRGVYKFHVICRIPLWEIGYDYPHGTSHGVGTCLNVHEEPYFSGSYLPCLDCVITIEPGCYMEEKNFGIRVENMYAIRRHPSVENYLHLECLTFFPFQRKMIIKELLNFEETDFVNWYHAKCREKLLPFFENDEEAREWIIKETLPL